MVGESSFVPFMKKCIIYDELNAGRESDSYRARSPASRRMALYLLDLILHRHHMQRRNSIFLSAQEFSVSSDTHCD